MKNTKYPLVCKTIVPIFTEEGNFIPKGTPVEVLHVSEGYKGYETEKRLVCRSSAYLFSGDIPEDLQGWKGNVGWGLYIEVPAGHLDFVSVESPGAKLP